MWRSDRVMKLFFASISPRMKTIPLVALNQCNYALESFFYIDDADIQYFKTRDMFILDSGAFTFLNNAKSNINWDKYVNEYALFIKKYDIDYFFEMDIDKIVGLHQVEEYRKYIESYTGKSTIPVWHRARGLDYWHYLCENYNYVAIGGVAIKDIKPHEYKYFHELLSIAKTHNTKVHGLGFTSRDIINYDFYSVDSSTWSSGGRYGTLFMFENNIIKGINPKNRRARNYKQIDEHNFRQWCLYQRFLDKI